MPPTDTWHVSEDDVCRLQGDGQRFTELMDDLLRAATQKVGIPVCDLITNAQVNHPDGGVDTELRSSASNPVADEMGWLRLRTVWQYKGRDTEHARQDLKTAIGGGPDDRYVKEKVREGYAFHFCAPVPLTAEKVSEWEAILDEQRNAVNTTAPKPRVLAASQISTWVSRFPALVCKYFRPHLANAIVLDHTSWLRTLELDCGVERYVPVEGWKDVRTHVLAHTDLSQDSASGVLLRIVGSSGVGKTRLICEAVRERAPLVIYTNDDETAEKLAFNLQQMTHLAAVLVADECGLETSARIENVLRPHARRVRVVAIDNSVESVSYKSHLILEKMNEASLLSILDENFPHVPVDQRRRAATLAEGYVRFAAAVCQDPDSATGSVIEYLRRCFEKWPADLVATFKLLALFTRLTFRSGQRGKPTELEHAAGARELDQSPAVLRDAVLRLNQTTGFVNVAGAICYVTPDIVAGATFELAWREIADPAAFIEALPERLADHFRRRVQLSASQPVCEEVASFFLGWIQGLTPDDLRDRQKVERLSNLCKLDATRYLPILRRLIESRSLDELRTITGAAQRGDWGPRRSLVWLAEELVSFAEHFDDAETILRQLALAESEPGIGNNATAVWTQLYRPYLSGTAVDFASRAERLEGLALSHDEPTGVLAIKAIGSAFAWHVNRVLGARMVGGRARPADWMPRSRQEQIEADRRSRLVETIGRVDQRYSDRRVQELEGVVMSNIRSLLLSGHLEELKQFSARNDRTKRLLSTLLEGIDTFLRFDTKDVDTPTGHEYVQRVKQWRSTLVPSGLRGRLIDTLGADIWHQPDSYRNREWQADLRALAKEMVAVPDDLSEAISYLNSTEAKNAGFLGEVLGTEDREARLWPMLRSHLTTTRSSFVRCYLMGLLASQPGRSDEINVEIDRVEASAPFESLDASFASPDLLHSFDRMLRLIEKGSLQLRHVRAFTTRHVLRGEQIERLLAFLSRPEVKSDSEATRLSLEIAYHWVLDLKREQRSVTEVIPAALGQTLFSLLEATVSDERVNAHEWVDLLSEIYPLFPDQALELAANALAAEGHFLPESIQVLLAKWAKARPAAVFNAVGNVLLNHPRGWHLQITKLTGLFSSFPVAVIDDWLRRTGVDGARKLARHLPLPFVDDRGAAVVPELTALVLDQFAHDDEVFQSFCAGAHSLQLYSGDIAGEHEREAEVAQRFRDHRLRRIREWARYEEESGKRQAEYWREQDAIWRTQG